MIKLNVEQKYNGSSIVQDGFSDKIGPIYICAMYVDIIIMYTYVLLTRDRYTPHGWAQKAL